MNRVTWEPTEERFQLRCEGSSSCGNRAKLWKHRAWKFRTQREEVHLAKLDQLFVHSKAEELGHIMPSKLPWRH